MFKTILTLAAFVLILMQGSAQKAVFKWSDAWTNKNEFNSVFSNPAEGVVSLEMEAEKNGYVPSLTFYDSTLKMQHNLKLASAKDGMTYVQTISTNDYLCIISKQLNKGDKTVSYYAQKVNPTSMQQEGETILIKTIPLYEQIKEPSVGFAISFNASKLLLYHFAEEKEGNRKVTMLVYNSKLEKEWENVADLGYPSLHSTVHSWAINNKGEVAVETSHFDETLDKRKVNGIELPTHRHEVFVFSKTHAIPEIIPFTVDDTYASNNYLLWKSDGSLQLFGLYRIRWNGNNTGVWQIRIDPVGKTVLHKQLTSFPITLLELLKTNGDAHTDKKDPGASGYYALFDVVSRLEGINYVLQLNYGERIVEGTYSNTSITRGSIISVFVKEDQPPVFAGLPIFQQEYNRISLCDFKVLPYKDALLVFYNESDKNLNQDINKRLQKLQEYRGSNLAMAVIKANGEVSRSSVLSYPDKKAPIIRVGLSKRVASNKLILYAANLSGFMSESSEKRIGTLTVE